MPDILTLGDEIKTAYEGEPDTNEFNDSEQTKLGVSREALSADRDYYVRTDGNDVNDGLSDSPSGAFFTIQKAADVIEALDLKNFQVTVNVGPGTYPTAVVLRPYVGSLAPLIVGDTVTPANVVLGSPALPQVVTAAGGGKAWRLEGVQLFGNVALRVADFGYLRFSDVDFDACGSYHMQVTNHGEIAAYGNYSISGGALVHKLCEFNSNIFTASRTVTLTGTPAFSNGYAVSKTGSCITAYNMTFNGGATGPRYEASINGVIFVNGAGANYFPGSSAGTTANGGQYV